MAVVVVAVVVAGVVVEADVAVVIVVVVAAEANKFFVAAAASSSFSFFMHCLLHLFLFLRPLKAGGLGGDVAIMFTTFDLMEISAALLSLLVAAAAATTAAPFSKKSTGVTAPKCRLLRCLLERVLLRWMVIVFISS